MNKKVLLIMLIAAVAAAIFPIHIACAADTYFEEGTVITEDADLHLRPTADSPAVTVLESGMRIGVFCEEEPGWYRVIFGNYRGYVRSENVFLASTDTMTGHVAKDGLHLRLHASMYSTVLCDISVGTALTISNIVGDWYEVSLGDQLGYVHKDYVELSTAKTMSTLLKPGMEGVAVADMQRALYSRGFFPGPVTGTYGDLTLAAVQAFQTEADLSANGIVDEDTLALLYGNNDIKTKAVALAGIEGQVQLSTWNEINKVWKKGTTATVTDVLTGLQYTAYRFGGWFHADCEPLTKEDTAIMKQMFGGTWSWDRRAIWVTIGDVTYAASQHGMPHMCDVVKRNNFNGHFCIHFNDSKIHATGQECPRHQACVDFAFEQAQ